MASATAKLADILRTDCVKIDTANATLPVSFSKVPQPERQMIQQPAAGQPQPSYSQPKYVVKPVQVTLANGVSVTRRIIVKQESDINFLSINPACKRSLPLPSDEPVKDKKQKIGHLVATSTPLKVITTESTPNTLKRFTTISQKPMILEQPLTSEGTVTATLKSSVPDTNIPTSAVSIAAARESEQPSEMGRKSEEQDSEELLPQYEPDEEVTDDNESISSAECEKLEEIYQFDRDVRPQFSASLSRGEGNCPPITQRKSSATGRRGNKRSGSSNLVSEYTPSIKLLKRAEANAGVSTATSSSSTTQQMKMKERELRSIWWQKSIAVMEEIKKSINIIAETYLESQH